MDFKVITPATSEPLVLGEARTQCRLTASDPVTEDALITTWITAAREIAEHYTGLALAPQTLEAVMDAFPCEQEAIRLPRSPVASVTSIKYTDTDGAEQTVDPLTYRLSAYGDARVITPNYGTYWPSTRSEPNAVRVRFVAGYGATGSGAGFAVLPKAVKSALLLMVAWLYEHRGDEMDPDDIQPPAAKALLGTVKNWARW